MPKSSALHHIVNVKNTCAYADCTLLNMQKADSENTSTHFVGRAHSSPALHLLPDSKSVGAPAHVIRVRSSSSSGGCPLGNDAFSRAECGTVTVVNKTNELKNLTEHPLSISSENVHFEGLENSVLSNIKRNDSFVDLGSQEALLAKVNETESDLVKLIRTSRGHSIESSGTALTNVDRLPDFAKTDQGRHRVVELVNNYLRQKQMKALSEQPEIRKSRKKIKRRNLQRKLFQSEHHMKQQGYQYEKLLDVMDNQGGDLTSMMSELEEDYIEEKTDFLHLFQLLVPKPELEEQKDMKTMIMSLRFISKLKKARAARLSREPKPPEEKPQQAPTVDVARSSRLLSMLKKRTLEKRASQTEVEPVDASDKALVQTLLNNPDLAFLTDEEILSSIIALRNARKKGVPEHLRMRNFMRSVQMQ
ncbi:predicted protein [Nematostella vectensis]|uniref:Uncharacterized protein n=1 Tax=Nematostella vectensis TaxID=45351 RepID=A7TB05_NEMVE|nr:predicted protein [Nematostella vectensis]|eukprot:XP_001618912.1 hypothetical protein NEMVEDRAFT_v1g224696 [Nematostella vectensis]